MKRFPVILIILLAAGSCDQPRFNFDHGIVPLEVVNFTDVNSRYDDYNSDIPRIYVEDSFTLVFSSNRNSLGADFDLVWYHCVADLQDVYGTFGIRATPEEYPLTDTINSAANEYGPYMTQDPYSYWSFRDSPGSVGTIFYTSDVTGDLDIYFWNYDLEEGFELLDSGSLTGLNSSFDDGYLCLHTVDSVSGETAYFTSDRDGDFDIFMATGETGRISTSANYTVSKVETLSGASDDKCPYIVNDMMVFTSDRDGGYGGFDLWYSTWDGSNWSDPVNFGEEINSEYNEYRPVIIPSSDGPLLNDILIFSSDRPGGLGGFDLYYTGMNKHELYFEP